MSKDSKNGTDINKDVISETCNKSQKQKSNNIHTSEEPTLLSFLSSNWIERWMWYGAALLLLLTLSLSLYNNYYVHLQSQTTDENAYKEYLRQRWSKAGDELLAAAAVDKSFTHYRHTRIFFRVITRKVPIPHTNPITYTMKIALAEVDQNNHWRSEYEKQPQKQQEKKEKEKEKKETSTRNTLRCVGDDDFVQLHIVGLRSNGVRFTSSYVSGEPPREHSLREHIPCLQKVLPLMCESDKWEVLCPPEEAFGEVGDSEVPPAATTVWRVSVEHVRRSSNSNSNNGNSNNSNRNSGEGGNIHTREAAEELLSLVAVEGNESVGIPLTRWRLFEKSNLYLANSTIKF